MSARRVAGLHPGPTTLASSDGDIEADELGAVHRQLSLELGCGAALHVDPGALTARAALGQRHLHNPVEVVGFGPVCFGAIRLTRPATRRALGRPSGCLLFGRAIGARSFAGAAWRFAARASSSLRASSRAICSPRRWFSSSSRVISCRLSASWRLNNATSASGSATCPPSGTAGAICGSGVASSEIVVLIGHKDRN